MFTSDSSACSTSTSDCSSYQSLRIWCEGIVHCSKAGSTNSNSWYLVFFNDHLLAERTTLPAMISQISETLAATGFRFTSSPLLFVTFSILLGVHGKAILKWIKARHDHILNLIDSQPPEVPHKFFNSTLSFMKYFRYCLLCLLWILAHIVKNESQRIFPLQLLLLHIRLLLH
jgi:hypothetical protein